ncbi:hypothetical protein PRIPAC_74541 [Pristionchus pacificus]|uniref:Retinoid-inducible serine carboxypeptidase n=1 Tax=Pristionchus pacificus TaxID=54126 RepID=A0A2A6C800_PRIPA|nr:hypothetical protein PRIPAC_74541 [Pristionchus pacificus]|eukprot:PDM74314.1 Peptidase [Pristionchus pacificus]
MISLLLVCVLAASALAATPPSKANNTVNTFAGPLKYNEDWGYSLIRTGAHTFWWLYAAEQADENRPLFMWLQGGPGSSSTGYGNFQELGPKTMTDEDNQATWLQLGDLIFVDNPVGTGFSYVESNSQYTTNVAEIGNDLVTWAIDFFSVHPEYRTRPFFIVCESYGGKMTAEFAAQLHLAVSAGVIPLTKFKGVGLGDSWISAMDYVNTWGEYLYAQSYLDEQQLDRVNTKAASCQSLVDSGKWSQATNCWSAMEELIEIETDGVSWYNVLKQGDSDAWSAAIKTNRIDTRTHVEKLYDRHVRPLQLDALDNYMDTVIRNKLGIIPDNVHFGAQSGMVFNKQSGDFMTPNWATVDKLLSYGLQVTVFNGQLDLICDTIGTERWINRLTWKGLDQYKAATKKPFKTKSFPLAGYTKTYQNFQMIYILRAGHMVAHDTEESGLFVLQSMIDRAK